jgi:hypothetical protein
MGYNKQITNWFITKLYPYFIFTIMYIVKENGLYLEFISFIFSCIFLIDGKHFLNSVQSTTPRVCTSLTHGYVVLVYSFFLSTRSMIIIIIGISFLQIITYGAHVIYMWLKDFACYFNDG